MFEMTPMLAAVILGALALIAFITWDRGCQCEKCGFHTNERRMAALKQAETDHDYSHRVGFECGDKTCKRNKLDD